MFKRIFFVFVFLFLIVALHDSVDATMPSYTLTINRGHGTAQVVPITGSGEHAISAGTREGFEFSHWTITGAGTLDSHDSPNTYVFFSLDNIVVTAHWAAVTIVEYSITIYTYENTTGHSADPPSGPSGTIMNINAGTRAGFEFSHWTSTPAVTFANYQSSSTSFSMPAHDVTIRPVWREAEALHSLVVQGGASGTGSYREGEEIVLHPGTRQDHEFIGWTVPANVSYVLEGQYLRLTMPARNITVVANWRIRDPYQQLFTVSVFGSHASFSGAGLHTVGSTVNIHAGVRAAYAFTGWTVTAHAEGLSANVIFANASSPSTTFVMPEGNVAVTANWMFVGQRHFLTVNGSRSDNPGQGYYNAGETVTIRAGSRSGYRFDGWTSSTQLGFANSNNTNTSFTMPAHNVTVTAHWVRSHDPRPTPRPTPRPAPRPTPLPLPTAPPAVEPPAPLPAAPVQDLPHITPRAPLSPIFNDLLAQISDTASALAAVETILDHFLSGGDTLTEAQEIELAIFSDLAIAHAASLHFEGSQLVLEHATIQPMQNTARETRRAVTGMLIDRGHEPGRELNAGVAFIIPNDAPLEIALDPSSAMSNIEGVLLRNSYFDLHLSRNFIQNENIPVHINITSHAPATARLMMGGDMSIAQLAAYINGAGGGQRSYTVSFSRPVTEPVRVSLPPIQGNPSYQAVLNSDGDIIGGNHNPVTGLMDVRIMSSDTFVVVENRVDFTDIRERSLEMQRAVRGLASAGLISGMTATEFGPDSPINRAQVASIITRLLGIHNPNSDGGFRDVSPSDWFFGAVGSARQHNLMTGTGTDIFSPNLNIPRDQITAISARILRREMRYRNPAVPMNYLAEFSDAQEMAAWSLADLSLATRENLVIRRADGRFMPRATITRGEASIILYRLYRRIW